MNAGTGNGVRLLRRGASRLPEKLGAGGTVGPCSQPWAAAGQCVGRGPKVAALGAPRAALWRLSPRRWAPRCAVSGA